MTSEPCESLYPTKSQNVRATAERKTRLERYCRFLRRLFVPQVQKSFELRTVQFHYGRSIRNGCRLQCCDRRLSGFPGGVRNRQLWARKPRLRNIAWRCIPLRQPRPGSPTHDQQHRRGTCRRCQLPAIPATVSRTDRQHCEQFLRRSTRRIYLRQPFRIAVQLLTQGRQIGRQVIFQAGWKSFIRRSGRLKRHQRAPRRETGEVGEYLPLVVRESCGGQPSHEKSWTLRYPEGTPGFRRFLHSEALR